MNTWWEYALSWRGVCVCVSVRHLTETWLATSKTMPGGLTFMEIFIHIYPTIHKAQIWGDVGGHVASPNFVCLTDHQAFVSICCFHLLTWSGPRWRHMAFLRDESGILYAATWYLFCSSSKWKLAHIHAKSVFSAGCWNDTINSRIGRACWRPAAEKMVIKSSMAETNRCFRTRGQVWTGAMTEMLLNR